MSTIAENVGTLLVLDIAFAIATGVTGIHGLIVDGGAYLGDVTGIDPWFDAHAGHNHAPIEAANGADYAATNVQLHEMPDGCHVDEFNGVKELHCGAHNDTLEM